MKRLIFNELIWSNVMKIAMITYRGLPRGGVVHSSFLAEALARRGHQVTLYYIWHKARDGSEGKDFYRKLAVPAECVTYSGKEAEVNKGSVEGMAAALAKSLPNDYDIYHVHDAIGAAGVRKMKKRTGKLVWTIHHLEPYNDPELDAFFDTQIRAVDGHATVSAYWQFVLKNKYGIFGRVIHNGVDLMKYHPKGDTTIWKERLNFFDEQKKMLLYVGGLEPRKGLEYMLLTFEIVLRRVPQTYLVVVGRSAVSSQPHEKDLIEILLDRTKTRNNVVFLDYVEDEDMPSLYSLAKMVVLTSRNEGWGLSLQEAMASGKPIGAFSVGGIPELVTNEFGILVPFGDAGSLAQGIVNVLKSSKRAKSMGKMARRRVEGFSWERSAKEAEFVYELLRRPPRRRGGPDEEGGS